MNNALLNTYKEELNKYKLEHFIYKQRLARYEDLNIPPTQDEINDLMMKNVFKEAYDKEQVKKDSDNDRVNQLIARLNKPIFNPFLENIIKYFEESIDKIEKSIE
jgi:hypothetical protein